MEFYCSSTAPRWLDLNPVAPWEVNQEPDQARDPVPSDHPGWELLGQVHPATWGRPVAAWDHPVGWDHLGEWVHQAAREHLVEPGRHPGQDHPAAWEHLGRVHPVAWGRRVAVWDHPVGWDHLGEWVHQAAWGRPGAGRVHPAEEDGRQVVNAIHKGVGKAIEIRLPTPFFGEVVDGLCLLGGTTYIDAELTKTQDGINQSNKVPILPFPFTLYWVGPRRPGTL